ncbi:hypothetical protein GQX74_005757 [Glossina fuscipes]|nr:hypothetical protein GQX74_005757 [Glossina fuscipes]
MCLLGSVTVQPNGPRFCHARPARNRFLHLHRQQERVNTMVYRIGQYYEDDNKMKNHEDSSPKFSLVLIDHLIFDNFESYIESLVTDSSNIENKVRSSIIRLNPNKTSSMMDVFRTVSPSSNLQNFPFARRVYSLAAFSRAKSLLLVLAACLHPSSSASHAYEIFGGSILKGAMSYHERQTSKYDRGWRKNLIMVMGNRWHLVWLSPFLDSKLPYDGVYF